MLLTRLPNEEFFLQVVAEEFILEAGVYHVAGEGEAEAVAEEEAFLFMLWWITVPGHLRSLLLQRMIEKISFLTLRYVEKSLFSSLNQGFLLTPV